MVEDVAITSVYQPPTQPRMTLAEHFQEILILLPRHTPWCCVGDHNDTPDDHIMLKDNPFPGLVPYFVADSNNHPRPTRNEGNRCIDYFLTNELNQINNIAFVDDEDIADHKIISATLHANNAHSEPDRPHRLLKSSKLLQPDQMATADWQRACDAYVNANPPVEMPEQATQALIDDLWNSISNYYENMLSFAISQHDPPQPRRRRHPRNLKNKITFSNHDPPTGQLDRANDSYIIRKLRNFSAKIREILKLQRAHRTHTTEYDRLQQKARRHPFFQIGMPWEIQLAHAEQELETERTNQRKVRIQSWRNKMQSSISSCYKWIKHTQYIPFRGLFSNSLNRLNATCSVTEALILIRDHWRLVWRRETFDLPAAIHRIDGELNRLGFQNPNVVMWEPLSLDQIAQRIPRLKGKAGGPDQWSGDEIAAIPVVHLQLFVDYCKLCESMGLLPTQWTFAVQCHLPKAQKGVRQSDGARDVCGLRPLTLFSAWYRLWSSTRLKTADAQQWLRQWWHPTAVGGRRGQEMYHALLPLISAATEGKYIVSLDYSLAFDYCHPQLATHFFRKTGMPQNICQMFFQQWTNQRRIITFDGFCLPTPEHVNCSLPQGDPFSLIAMVAVMMPAISQIEREYPSVIQRSFVDDRSWAAPSATVALQVEALWTSWSTTLNLRENTDKTQYYHSNIAGRRSFANAGAPRDKITDQVCILGNIFTAARRRSIHAKERDRLASAKSMILRAGCLPLSLKGRRAVIAAGPMAKAEFGWCMYDPPLRQCDAIDRAIRRALREPKQSCVHLRNIFRGHRLNIRYRILTACVNALHRTGQAIPFPIWHRIGIAGTINKFLMNMSWMRVGPWEWTHSITSSTFCLNPASRQFTRDRMQLNHLLREGFRADCFKKWSMSTRNDAEACQYCDYNENRCQRARQHEQNAQHRFAILTGGFVSPAAFDVMKNTNTPCRCGAFNSLDHMVWWCQQVPSPSERPPVPTDWLQRRLGWPSGSPYDEATISWMVRVREWSLTNRYKPPTHFPT